MKTRLLVLAGAVILAVVARALLPSFDRALDGADVLPPGVGGVPLNESKPPGHIRSDGTVINVSNLSGNEAEVSLDVNPENPDNLVILGHAPNLRVINSFYTLDGGQTWTRVTLGDAEDGLTGWLRGDPSVVFDDEGNVYLAYGVRQRTPNRVTIVVARSADGGRSYTQLTHVDTNLDIGAYPGDDKWHLATGPDPDDPIRTNVYLAWTQNIDEGGAIDQRVVIAQSSDRGATFSAPVIVNDASISGTSLSNSHVDPAVGPNGEVYVEWYNIITRTIYVDYSPGDLVFGEDVEISTSQTGALTPIPAQPSRGVFTGPTIDVDRSNGPYRGRLYAVYTDVGAGGLPDVDVFVRYSDDQAATWSPRSLVNDDGGTGSQFLPWLDVDQVLGVVGVSFYDTRNDPENGQVEVFVAPSYDGGDTFAENVAISAAPSDQSGANPYAWSGNYLEYIGLVVHNGRASAVWSDNSTDPADLDFFFGNLTLTSPASAPDLGVAGPDLVWLGAPAPSPSRQHTQLTFRLAVPANARLAVYDLLGRSVRVLLDEERSAGEHISSWDGCDARGRTVSPGMYFCRLDACGQSKAQKIIVGR